MTIGDFDGDGVRDEWVWISGLAHWVLMDPAAGDVSFDPPAPEVWNDVGTTAP